MNFEPDILFFLQDVHGNTALHLAVMLGCKECIKVLCSHDAPTNVKNNLGWTPLAEAIRYNPVAIFVW